MAFGKKGAPMGNKNAAGSRGGAIRRGAVKVAKVAGYTAALGAGAIATAAGAGMFITSQLENATGVKKRSTSSFNKGSKKKP